MRQATITDDQESSAQVEVGLRGAKDVMKILCGLGDEFTWSGFIEYYILIMHESIRFNIERVSDICE